MERRSFIVKAGALFSLPLVITEIGCDSNGDIDDGNSFLITSTVNSGHSHRVTISRSNVNDPPTSNVTLTSTSSSGHVHTITLTTSDYERLMKGETIDKKSSSSSKHTHTFRIKVPS